MYSNIICNIHREHEQVFFELNTSFFVFVGIDYFYFLLCDWETSSGALDGYTVISVVRVQIVHGDLIVPSIEMSRLLQYTITYKCVISRSFTLLIC